MRSLGRVLVALALGSSFFLTVLTAGAPGAASLRPPPGTPDPKQMVLTTADLGGAEVTRQRYYKDTDFPSVISYQREFEFAAVGPTELVYVDSEAEIGTSARTTSSFLRTIRRVFTSKQGRALLKSLFPSDGLVSKFQVGKVRSLGVGQDSFDLPMSARLLGVRTELRLSAFRVEQVLGSLVLVGTPGERVSRSVMVRLAKTMAARMTAELAPRNTVPPTISGTAQAAETLTAAPGTWAGAPTTFTYQWQRCDPSGANCADIPTATGETYLVTDADVGSTIRVVVTARNAGGSATASSTPTLVVFPVPAPGAPKPIVKPSILGTAQVGQTLTVATGTWTGNPTSFEFQWVRCPASLVGCGEALPGATQGTYVVSTGDVGSRIWVNVTATNEFGKGRTSSAPTAAVVP